jgi:hypothetical protein
MRDLPLIFKEFYKNSGSNFPTTPFHSLVDLVEWVLRIPSQTTRYVYKSTKLQQKILTSFELRGLSDVESLTLMGGNLKPYLGDMTRSIRNRSSKNNDLFSSDWGLLHFHLGADFENKGARVGRTKRVLIARFENDCAYFIDVVNHGKGHPDVWGDVSHLEILYRNWPNIFGEGLRVDVEETIPRSSSDYIKLRNSGINTPIVIDGKAFTAPGLGIAMDRSQSQAVQISLQINRELEQAEASFRKVEPFAKAFLALKKDYSMGFFVPKTNTYYCSYKYSENNQITQLFFRLLSEIPLPTNKTYNDFFLPK